MIRDAGCACGCHHLLTSPCTSVICDCCRVSGGQVSTLGAETVSDSAKSLASKGNWPGASRDAAETLAEVARAACWIPKLLRAEADHSEDCLSCESILSALSRVVERACKAVCPFCEEGKPLVRTGWHEFSYCRAVGIRRALALPEPVQEKR
jgi:hypothetical protein